MNGWMVASWLITGPILLDLIRRPEAEWIAGDRRKWVWVTFAVACLWIYVLVIYLGIAYVTWLLPAFDRSGGSPSGSKSKFSHD